VSKQQQKQARDVGFTAMLGELEDGGIIHDGSIKIVQKGKGDRELQRNELTHACYTGLLKPYQDHWFSWFHSVETFAPAFRVKTDAELRKIITQSAATRPMGSTHTKDDMIIQRTEEDVVVVSLADHSPDHPDWATPSINVTTGKAWLHADMSWYEAVPVYHPRGFVLRERPPLRFFTVGGLVSNMVHGGSNTGGFVHQDVTMLLVMLSDGSVQEVEGDDLSYWRYNLVYSLLGDPILFSIKLNG